MGPPGLAAPNLLSQPWLRSALAFPVAEGWGDWESRWSEKCRVSSPALNLLSLAPLPSLEKVSQEAGAMAWSRHCVACKTQLSNRAATARREDGRRPAPLTALPLRCRWQRVTGCRPGSSLLDFMPRNTYLLLREGTMGLMGLSGFDVPPGDIGKQ